MNNTLKSSSENSDTENNISKPSLLHGSLGNLAPSWWESSGEAEKAQAWLSPDEALDRFLEWVKVQDISPWDHQEQALLALMMGSHVILGTPTGSGKSLVALGLHFMALCSGRRSYYTAPIKALVSEKFFALVQVFGRENVGMITGDTSINACAPLICCTAEILANEALRQGEQADVGCVIMDEFHYYGDAERGWAWQVPLLTLPKTQFLLMSATLGSVTSLALSLEEKTGTSVEVIANALRPVPLTYEYVEIALEGAVELALRKGEGPLYVVHFSQDSALTAASSLANFGVATKEQRDAIKQAMRTTRFSTAFGKVLKRLLVNGVGIHHAGMLPRYRLLVEKLAQQGCLPVICGTDTLGVGINVPIHTVLLTALIKFDGSHTRRLKAREFHQIAGRAGRSGFDTEGVVLVQAPEHERENAKLLQKAGGDPKKIRKIKKKRPPQGSVTWSRKTFERLIEAPPETLKPHLSITHSMVLSEVVQGGDAKERMRKLIKDSAQSDDEKEALLVRSESLFETLIRADVVDFTPADDGTMRYYTTIDIPANFALDQPLSPFLLAALELLDPESETYAFDVISMVEATLENPYQILRAQIRVAKSRALADMRAEGLEYEQRMERLAEITYPQPLKDLLEVAFDRYSKEVPWARDFQIEPKSIVRDMLETASDFKTYVQRYNIARSEGLLLRYLNNAYHVFARTIPAEKCSEYLRDVIAWLGVSVATIDSSLLDEWKQAGDDRPGLPTPSQSEVVGDRHGLTLMVRNALFARVRLAAHRSYEKLGELDKDWGYTQDRWQEALARYYEHHREVLVDADARSAAYFLLDTSDEMSKQLWHVRQILSDPYQDHDFGIAADVTIDATQEQGEVIFQNYRVGFFEDIMGS